MSRTGCGTFTMLLSRPSWPVVQRGELRKIALGSSGHHQTLGTSILNRVSIVGIAKRGLLGVHSNGKVHDFHHGEASENPGSKLPKRETSKCAQAGDYA